MARISPAVLTPGPAYLLVLLAGVVGTILMTALLFLAPAFGLPFLDLPRLVGGLFTADPEAAFTAGYVIFFLIGVVILAPALTMAWPSLPGRDEGWRGALLKGLLWGVLLWVVGGILIALLGAVNRLDEPLLIAPGLFALRMGLGGALLFFAGCLGYSLSVALIADMGQSINPIDTLGWKGYRPGLTPLVRQRSGSSGRAVS